MKKRALFTGCFLAVTLTACNAQSNNTVTEPTDSVTSAIVSEETEAETIPEAEEITVKEYSPDETETAEIDGLLSECSDFLYDYICCKEVKNHINENSAATFSDNIKWFEITSGDVTAMSALEEKMSAIFTDNAVSQLEIGNYYAEENGRLYLSETAGNDGGVMGTDITYIESVSAVDENTLILNMVAFGDKNYWELPENSVERFSIEIIRTEDGLRINSLDLAAQSYIAWTYGANPPVVGQEKFPEITITAESSAEEIMQAGKAMGMYYSSLTDRFFEYGIIYDWKTEPAPEEDGEVMGYRKSYGYYINKAAELYVPMNFPQTKAFIMSTANFTEKCFNELNENSPSGYRESDGSCFIKSGDGGGAGWDCSYIKDYEMSDDGNSVTYFCERFGSKEEWGYEEDMIKAFTFTVTKENDIWKLDGCTDTEAFSSGFVGLISDR